MRHTAGNAPRTDLTDVEVAWLAGILEGEGSFCFISGKLTISLVMTDRDVVERVAGYFGTTVNALKPRAVEHKRPYSVLARGARAAYFMRLVQPLMGARRQTAIDLVLARFQEEVADKSVAAGARVLLADQQLEQLWTDEKERCSSFREFCAAQGLSRRVAQRRLARLAQHRAGGDPYSYGRGARLALATPTTSSFEELDAESLLSWLAGLLEGEGYFSTSGAKSMRIGLHMRDEDVVQRAALLLGSRMCLEPRRRPHWADLWATSLSGKRAFELAKQLLPLMGSRRRTRIAKLLLARQ